MNNKNAINEINKHMDIYKWVEENILDNPNILNYKDKKVVYTDEVLGISTIKDVKYNEVYFYKVPKDENVVFLNKEDKVLCVNSKNNSKNNSKYKVYIKFACV